jgi:hypothetical protein
MAHYGVAADRLGWSRVCRPSNWADSSLLQPICIFYGSADESKITGPNSGDGLIRPAEAVSAQSWELQNKRVLIGNSAESVTTRRFTPPCQTPHTQTVPS